MSVCVYCGGAPVDPIPRGSLTINGRSATACWACWAEHDDEDERATLLAAAVVPAPEVPEPVERRVRQPFRDLTGQRFGDLTVMHSVELQRGRKVRTYWVCRCGSCGRSLPFLPESLRHGTKRCKACATARANRSGPLRGVAATRVGHPRRAAA